MKLFIARLICKFTSHRRGKFLRAEDNGRVKIFGCPRCRREKRYKAAA